MSSAASVIVHDTRLLGTVPRTYSDRLVSVNDSHSLNFVLRSIRQAAIELGGVPSSAPAASRASLKLTIMCHGRIALDGGGHYYLELGHMGLQLTTVAEARMLRGYFSKIKVKACGALGGHTPVPPDVLTAAVQESDRLFHKLAKKTDTPVIASDTAQEYDAPDVTPRFWGSAFVGDISFGAWEGNLFEYSPGGARRQVTHA